MAELTRRCAQCVSRFEGMVDKFHRRRGHGACELVAGEGVVALE
jgi:hypothetical protein